MSQSTKPFVVLFSAPWCGPCKTLKPLLLEKLGPRYAELIDIKVVDMAAPDDEGEALIAQHDVKTVPVVASSLGHKHIGAMTESTAISWLNDVTSTLR